MKRIRLSPLTLKKFAQKVASPKRNMIDAVNRKIADISAMHGYSTHETGEVTGLAQEMLASALPSSLKFHPIEPRLLR